MRSTLVALVAVLALTPPAAAHHDTNLPVCVNHQVPDKGSCIYDARHSPDADSIYAPVSYRLWADGTQVYVTHHRAHHLLYGAKA
ncbi:MAG TPA: hypothetical protein VJ782_02275 [Aeromicrobium sp.]|nr:hypothetical protein [Aeromicrobium sp.]